MNMEEEDFHIKEAEIYFIYTFLFSPINLKTILKKGQWGELRDKLKREIKRRSGFESEVEIRFCEEQDAEIYRFSRHLVLNIPYLRLKLKPFKIPHSYITAERDRIEKPQEEEDEVDDRKYKLTPTFRLYESGSGLLRICLHLPPQDEDKNVITINKLPKKYPVSRLCDEMGVYLWKNEAEKQISDLLELLKQISDLFESFEKTFPKLEWYERDYDLVAQERDYDLVAQDRERSWRPWQTPSVMVCLKLPKYDYRRILWKEHENVFRTQGEKVTKFLARFLFKATPVGDADIADISFCGEFLPMDKQQRWLVNMCHSEIVFYYLTTEALLYVYPDTEEDEPRVRELIEKNIKSRLLELAELLRSHWYNLVLSNQILDINIQDIESIYEECRNYIKESKGKSALEQREHLERRMISKIKDYLSEWIHWKCIILRSFEDPGTRRCAGTTYDVVYNHGRNALLMEELEDSVKLKLEHLDRIYDDIMDLIRLEHYDPTFQ